MSNLLTDIFSSISSEDIIEAGKKTKIPSEKIDQISFDSSEVILSDLGQRVKDAKEAEVILEDIKKYQPGSNKKDNGQDTTIRLMLEKERRQAVKDLSGKNSIKKAPMDIFLREIENFFFIGLSETVQKNELKGNVFSQIISMSSEAQEQESRSKGGIIAYRERRVRQENVNVLVAVIVLISLAGYKIFEWVVTLAFF